jgi:hypothetical protein
MAMNWPRDVCDAVSVAHTGTMALSIPVPNPLISRAGISYERRRLTKDHPNVIHRARLQRRPQNTPCCADRDCLDPANALADPSAKECAA